MGMDMDMDMDPPFPGAAFDLCKRGELAMDEKRKLVYELAKWPDDASEMLQSWSRKDILEILCVEMGKERKYTGLSKQKLVELLLRLVLEKSSEKQSEERDSASNPPSKPPSSSKRQRKADNPSRLPVEIHIPPSNDMDVNDNPKYCQNIACKAPLTPDHVFCKRCSCCICYRFDDNKDPSLWLFCSSDNSSGEVSCGMSCHIECALKCEKTGMTKNMHGSKLDGSFFCASCGKTNDLLGYLRKQLIAAKDARRVDILCHRISLSHKLLDGTKKYKKLLDYVDDAMKKLETEVGPITGLAIGMARGIVNRLSTGTEIQKLCLLAVDSLDSIVNSASRSSPESITLGRDFASSAFIRLEDVSSTSATVVVDKEHGLGHLEEVSEFRIWQRADFTDYPVEPTCTLVRPNGRFLASELSPSTKYTFKVVALNGDKELGMCEAEVVTGSALPDVPESMPLQEEPTVPPSPKTNSSNLSDPSECDESNNTAIYQDLNKLPEECHNYHDKNQPPDVGKSVDGNDFSNSQDTCLGTMGSSGTEANAAEGTPAHSVSALDEEPNSIIHADICADPADAADRSQVSDTTHKSDASDLPPRNDMSMVPYGRSESVLPVTPSKLEAGKEGTGRTTKPRSGSSGPESWLWKPVKDLKGGNPSRKRSVGSGEETRPECALEGNYEYCVKVVRWLECKGHIETNFRVKFLTWFSLRATPQERKVVSVFVDTLIDDPPSLAGQLVDAFSEGISRKRQPEAPARGFCMRLWH